MRRARPGDVLFALALAIQALAPAAAPVAMARAFAGLGFGEKICWKPAETGGERQQPSGQRETRREFCPLCQISCSGVAPFEPKSTPVRLAPARWAALARPKADRFLPAARREFSRQARAPPAFS